MARSSGDSDQQWLLSNPNKSAPFAEEGNEMWLKTPKASI